MSAGGQDILAWPEVRSGRLERGAVRAAGDWSWTLRRSASGLGAGWWRVRAQGSATVEIELRRVGSDHVEFLSLPSGRWRAVRLAEGAHEGRVWLRAKGDTLTSVMLEPAPAAWLLPARAMRAARRLRMLARHDRRSVSDASGPTPAFPTTAPSSAAVGVIIPTRDNAALLDRCLTSLFEVTQYADVRVLVVDNGSVDPDALAALDRWKAHPQIEVLVRDEPFNFARLCNAGAETMQHREVLVFLNDDIEVIAPDWLSILVGEVMASDVGAAGPLLLYPDGTVQHAGIALGVLGHAGHPWRGADPAATTEVLIRREVSAVTGACLAVRAEAYRTIGGMDEAAFPVTFNDVDLCLRLRARGLKTIYQPAARLIHLEGRSRKPDHLPEQAARRGREVDLFLERHGSAVDDDPFYGPDRTRADESARPR